jgi:hypothetical protein
MTGETSPLAQLARELTFRNLTPEQQRMWKKRMRHAPAWFVVRKSLWKTDRWRAVAGPFRNQHQAQRLARQLSLEMVDETGQRMYRTQVKSLSEIMHMYNNHVVRLVDDLLEAERVLSGTGMPTAPPHQPDLHV